MKCLINKILIKYILIGKFIVFFFRPRIQGPLSMYPQRRDNFGVDSCALLVLPTNPMTVVIAEPTGKLYHAILIESTGNPLENVSNYKLRSNLL